MPPTGSVGVRGAVGVLDQLSFSFFFLLIWVFNLLPAWKQKVNEMKQKRQHQNKTEGIIIISPINCVCSDKEDWKKQKKQKQGWSFVFFISSISNCESQDFFTIRITTQELPDVPSYPPHQHRSPFSVPAGTPWYCSIVKQQIESLEVQRHIYTGSPPPWDRERSQCSIGRYYCKYFYLYRHCFAVQV